jgi:hypothetical protein
MAVFCEYDNEHLSSTDTMARFKSTDFQGRYPSSGDPKKEPPNSSKMLLLMH